MTDLESTRAELEDVRDQLGGEEKGTLLNEADSRM